MAFIHRSNNRVLPANARAVDVAKQAIRDIMPVQQRRYHAAFEVQGFEAIIYHRLRAGVPCSCQAHRKQLASHLEEDGKMPVSTMNKLLTGQEFGVNQYGARVPARQDIRDAKREAGQFMPRKAKDDQFFDGLDSNAPLTHEYVIGGLDDPFTQVTEPGLGVNGPDNGIDLDSLADDFDTGTLDMSTTRCGVCYGIGFVGGFSVLNAWRVVLDTTKTPSLGPVDGTIEVNVSPHAFFARSVEWNVVIPRGFVSLDAFKVWNNMEPVTGGRITIDDLEFSDNLLRAFCDGRSHKIRIEFDDLTDFTHIEIQINQSLNSALIEFPRLTNTSNTSLNDMTGDVTMNASPIIPRLNTGDVVVESTFGKHFVVSESQWWNDRDRNVLGWDVQARVIQPEEILHGLPRRRRLGQRTTNLVRDNINGIRRT